MKRRNFLLGLGPAIATGGTIAGHSVARKFYQAKGPELRDFSVVGDQPLRVRAAAKQLSFGSAVQRKHLENDPIFAQTFAQECSRLVPETSLKWSRLRPSPKTYNFADADWLVDFAQRHQMQVRGHTLIWHEALPQWTQSVFAAAMASSDQERIEQFMAQHIQTVVGHFAGKIQAWDVVNEAIRPDQGHPDGLRDTPWLKALGPGYIEMAFHLAAHADPKAMLVYNDFGMEYDAPWADKKRVAVLRLLETLKSKSVPIHALGMQSHLMRHQSHFDPEKLRKFLREVAQLDLKILITELDVTDESFATNILQRDLETAAIYEDYLSIVLSEPAVIEVSTWGISDRYTWIAKDAPRRDGTPVRPLPLDAKLNRKKVWNAIARSFDNAPTFDRQI